MSLLVLNTKVGNVFSCAMMFLRVLYGIHALYVSCDVLYAVCSFIRVLYSRIIYFHVLSFVLVTSICSSGSWSGHYSSVSLLSFHVSCSYVLFVSLLSVVQICTSVLLNEKLVHSSFHSLVQFLYRYCLCFSKSHA